MTVLEAVRGIEVTVCVDEQALQEYDDDEVEVVSADVEEYQASRTVAKYIESHTGHEFMIKIQTLDTYKPDSPILSFKIYVDGMNVSSPNINPHSGLFNTRTIRGIETILENGNAFVEPFLFKTITTSADDEKLASVKEDAKRLSDVGEIVVKVHRRGERIRSQKQSKRLRASKKLAADSSASVHEKALKGQAMSHSTTLGAPQATTASNVSKMSYVDGKDKPIAIYRFKYRSKESLKSLLILKRTPEPSPSPSPSPAPIPNGASGSFDLESLDATQKAKLQEFLGNLMGDEAQPNGERKIKREREKTESKANKRPKRGERVEVDLTGDDSG
ncbi:hypothetical protein EAE96_000337 [Botrytis aclada]|nr:hypothetical protein EAE96_000337 [Botrytis aclada]